MIARLGLPNASFAGLNGELTDQVGTLPDLQHSERAMDHHLSLPKIVRLSGRRDFCRDRTMSRNAQREHETKGNAQRSSSPCLPRSGSTQGHCYTVVSRGFFPVRALSKIALLLLIFATNFTSLPVCASSLDQILQSSSQTTRSAGQSVEELITQAEAAYDRGEYSRAVTQYQQAVAMFPGGCLAHRVRGLTLQIQGKLTDAIENYLKALACDPEDYLAMEKLARIYEHMGEKIQEATELYRRASQLDSRPDRREELITWASMLKDRLADTNTSAAKLWNLCTEHSGRAEWERAGQCYSRVIALNPRFYQAFFSRAEVWMEKGDYEAAIRDLDTGLALSPIYPGGHVARGLAHENLGDLEKASRDFALAAETDAMDAAGFYHLGRMYEKRQQVGEALNCYRKALGLRPRADLLDAIQRQMAAAERAPRQSPAAERDRPSKSGKHLW